MPPIPSKILNLDKNLNTQKTQRPKVTANETWTRITKSKKYAEYVNQGAATLSRTKELNINKIGSGSLLQSTAQIIFLHGIWNTARGRDPLRTLNKHLQLEHGRTVCGFVCPRLNHFLWTLTNRYAQSVKISEAQTLEKSIECGSKDCTDHDPDNITCQITAVQSFFAYKQPLWETSMKR